MTAPAETPKPRGRLFPDGPPHKSIGRSADVVYHPWEWLYNHSGTAHAFFDWYIALWERYPVKHPGAPTP
jgi:hypothetical protein